MGTVQAELASLEQAGILTKTVSGNRTYYRANSECAMYPELRCIILKAVGLVDVLREKMTPLATLGGLRPAVDRSLPRAPGVHRCERGSLG